jgi:hypothetical protein
MLNVQKDLLAFQMLEASVKLKPFSIALRWIY